MDLQKTADEIGIDVETLKKLFKSFISSTPDDLLACKSGIEAKNSDAVRTHAHHIKGAAINLDIQGLAEKAKMLEDAAKRVDWTEISQYFSELESLYHSEEKKIKEHL